MLRPLPIAAAFLLGGASAALAQTDPMLQARMAAYNAVGVMEYCQSRGYADDAAVTAQRTMLTRLPAAPLTADMTTAEDAGKSGKIASPNGTTTTLAEMAGKTNMTEAALCGRMVDSAKQMSAMAMPNGMAAMPGGMPAMPGGMPAMPGGMPGMPMNPGGLTAIPGLPGTTNGSVPGLPAMPGVPPAR